MIFSLRESMVPSFIKDSKTSSGVITEDEPILLRQHKPTSALIIFAFLKILTCPHKQNNDATIFTIQISVSLTKKRFFTTVQWTLLFDLIE